MKKDIVIKTFAAVIVWKRVSMPITDKGLQKHNSSTMVKFACIGDE